MCMMALCIYLVLVLRYLQICILEKFFIMTKMAKHIASIITVAVFIIIAVASSTSYRGFTYNTNVFKKPSNSIENYAQPFIVLKNGDTIIGDNLSKAGFLSNKMKIDGEKVKIKDVFSYYDGTSFYRSFGRDAYYERIVHGKKISIYKMIYTESSSFNDFGSSRSRTTYRTKVNYMYSINDNQKELYTINSVEALQKALEDCPDVISRIPEKTSIKSLLKKDPYFFTNIINDYNSTCGK